MSEKGILKKIDDIFNYCEEIDNHFPKEEQTGYRMLPDIFYIKKEVNNLQQKVEQLEKENKILKENAEHNDKVVDKVNWENMLLKRKNKEIDRLNNIIDELEKYLEEESKYDEYVDVFYREHMGYVLDKLKKLKEDK